MAGIDDAGRCAECDSEQQKQGNDMTQEEFLSIEQSRGGSEPYDGRRHQPGATDVRGVQLRSAAATRMPVAPARMARAGTWFLHDAGGRGERNRNQQKCCNEPVHKKPPFLKRRREAKWLTG
jgi:hypothetical protein